MLGSLDLQEENCWSFSLHQYNRKSVEDMFLTSTLTIDFPQHIVFDEMMSEQIDSGLRRTRNTLRNHRRLSGHTRLFFIRHAIQNRYDRNDEDIWSGNRLIYNPLLSPLTKPLWRRRTTLVVVSACYYSIVVFHAYLAPGEPECLIQMLFY